MSRAVIIEAAINGATPKARNPHVPVTPDEIAADALACVGAGAAIIHNHIDQGNLTGPDAAKRYLEAWRPALTARPDALFYPTVNFKRGGHDYEHIAPLAESGLMRMSLCDPGSVNFGKIVDGIPLGDRVYTNTFDDVAHQLELCHRYGLGPSIAIYEPGFLRTVIAYYDAGLLPRGSLVKLYLAAPSATTAVYGLPPIPESVSAYMAMIGERALPWAVSVPGGDVVASGMAALALELGGHLHLGLEFYGGSRQPTNVELISEAVALIRHHGHEAATPAQAASILDLPAPFQS